MDQIGNLITTIRNAEMVDHSTLTVRYSKTNLAILEILKETGYVSSFAEITEGKKKDVAVTLPQPVEKHHYRRLSKPGRRLYTPADRIPTILRGLGIVVISTSKGLMIGKKAKKLGLGGELLFEAY